MGQSRPLDEEPVQAPTAFILMLCDSGVGVSLFRSAGSGMREAMLSGTRSGDAERERSGYSRAGEEALRRRDVVGCGSRTVGGGDDVSAVSPSARGGWTMVAGPGPVRTRDGRICSKPWARATFSRDLKYWFVAVSKERGA